MKAEEDGPEAMVMLKLKGWGHKKGKKGRVVKYSFCLKEEDPDEESPVKDPMMQRLEGGEPREMRHTYLRINPSLVPG